MEKYRRFFILSVHFVALIEKMRYNNTMFFMRLGEYALQFDRKKTYAE